MRVREADLAYDLSGTPDVGDVVWGHGLSSSRDREDAWPLLDWEQLRRTARVLRYDARGHGESSSPEDLASYSWASLAEDQLALADELGIDRYVAAGASMGCATALHAAVLAPDRVRALVLVIPPTAWSTRAAQVDAYKAMADLIESGDHETLFRLIGERPSPDPYVDDPDYAGRFEDLVRNSDPTRLARVFRGAATADLPSPEAVSAIDVPTLILAWTGDAGHPASSAAHLMELIDGSELALAATPTAVAGWTVRVERFLAQL